MTKYKLGEIEMRFADIIWNNEPLSSGELVKLAEKELSWNRIEQPILFYGGYVNAECFKMKKELFLRLYQKKISCLCKVKNSWKMLFQAHCQNF